MSNESYKILIVDDEPNMLHMLGAILKQDGFDPTCTTTPQEALDIAANQQFDFILSDVRMPGMDGIQLVENLRSRGIESIVVLMSAYGNIDLALQAMQKGAYDYISKPFKTDEVVLTLRKAAERERLRREVIRLKRRLMRCEVDSEIVFRSSELLELIGAIRRIAPFDSSVLITGESGTGKELVAKEIHRLSSRRHGPFIPVHCGGIPEGLLESELFGHSRGAFTGATMDRQGLFEEAEGGTLLLDEIGSMAPALQTKLFRALDSGEIRRIGENTTRKVSVRILAATNENLEKAMETGAFRKDFFYRLNVMHIHIPPLREHADDVMPLVEHFVAIFNKKMGLKIKHVTREAETALKNYAWKGNVRELQNVVERAMILASGDSLALENLPPDMILPVNRIFSLPNEQETLSMKKAVKNLEKTLIIRALNRTGGNKSQAAGLLEISYPSLLQKMRDHSIV
jgi:two-component system, NtrC family, response regulator AtoC